MHDWSFDPAAPVRVQVTTLARYTKSWLEEAAGPPIVDQVVNDAKRYVAQQGTLNIDTLMALLENHRVMGSMMRPSVKHTNSKANPERETSGKAVSPPITQMAADWTRQTARRVLRPPPRPRCFSCGREGYLAREWTGMNRCLRLRLRASSAST